MGEVSNAGSWVLLFKGHSLQPLLTSTQLDCRDWLALADHAEMFGQEIATW